jgi:hypothetical protein
MPKEGGLHSKEALMVPAHTDPVWKKLVTGEKELRSTQLGINMLLTNNRLKYKKNSTPASLNELCQYTREFFVKYENTFKDELKQLFG